ncbi:28363_t:CDS:2 [Dentiscutata erythropus]|uniref:28363_t:CDS:1 n=1 Tax=Dentiscutata erythropus TaxID=1348616 RepID=A0A9N9P047_9GLOM|nr:28363_t:CDS:2 [Dentiscutata erythropus]
MSGRYKYKDIPHSTWNGCCKLPIGNSYMLEEISEQFRDGSPETFLKLRSFNTQCRLLETSNMIFQLRDEHNDILFKSSKLSGSLSAYPFIPNKDKHKIGIKDANEDSDLDNFLIRSGKNDKK